MKTTIKTLKLAGLVAVAFLLGCVGLGTLATEMLTGDDE